MHTLTMTTDAATRPSRMSLTRLCRRASALAAVTAALLAAHPASAQSWQQPFSSGSIWNTRVNPNATFVPANLGPLGYLADDVIYLLQAGSGDPFTYVDNGFGGRLNLNIPASFFPPDSRQGYTPNNNTAVLDPDGVSVWQFSPAHRVDDGGGAFHLTGFFSAVDGSGDFTQSLSGDGTLGQHEGSGLSILGGTIRHGELTGDGGAINHAVKIELDYAQLYHDPNDSANNYQTYRWPARFVDGAATNAGNDGYHGQNSSLRAGSLLAIPPTDGSGNPITADSLGITTEPGRRLFAALQTYGAYQVDTDGDEYKADNGGYNANLCFEDGVDQDFTGYYPDLGSLSTGGGAWHDDLSRLYQALQVVDSNGPNSIGG